MWLKTAHLPSSCQYDPNPSTKLYSEHHHYIGTTFCQYSDKNKDRDTQNPPWVSWPSATLPIIIRLTNSIYNSVQLISYYYLSFHFDMLPPFQQDSMDQDFAPLKYKKKYYLPVSNYFQLPSYKFYSQPTFVHPNVCFVPVSDHVIYKGMVQVNLLVPQKQILIHCETFSTMVPLSMVLFNTSFKIDYGASWRPYMSLWYISLVTLFILFHSK